MEACQRSQGPLVVIADPRGKTPGAGGDSSSLAVPRRLLQLGIGEGQEAASVRAPALKKFPRSGLLFCSARRGQEAVDPFLEARGNARPLKD